MRSLMNKSILIIAPNFPPINKVSSLRPYYLSMLLKEQGWDVTVVASVDDEDGKGLIRSEEGINVIRFASFWAACLIIIKLFFSQKAFNAIVSTYGPTSAHLLGTLAKFLFRKAIWLADYRDLWMSGSYYSDKKQGVKHKLKEFVEKVALRDANILTTVSSGLKENLEHFHHKSVEVVYNGYEPITQSLTPVKPNDNIIQVCYTGNMYMERSPLLLLQVIAEQHQKQPQPLIKLVIAGVVGDDVKLQLKQYEDAGLVEYKGKLPREASYDLQRSSDYCLLVENYDATLKGVLTGKVFEYIGMGKPVIALGVAEKSEMAQVIDKSGLMAFCGQEKQILESFVGKILRNESLNLQRQEDFIISLERNHQSQKFITLIEKSLLK